MVTQRAKWIVPMSPRNPGGYSLAESCPITQKIRRAVNQRTIPGLRWVTDSMWFCAARFSRAPIAASMSRVGARSSSQSDASCRRSLK